MIMNCSRVLAAVHCRLRPQQQGGPIPTQGLGTAHGERHVAADLEVELHHAIAGDQLQTRFLVGEVGDDHVDLVADPGQLPVALAFFRRERNAGTQQIPLGVAPDALYLRRLLQVGECVGEGMAGAGEDRPEQPSTAGRAAFFSVCLAA